MPVSHTHRQGAGTHPVSGNTAHSHNHGHNHEHEREREREQDIARIGQAIRDAGLSAPAAIALSAFRPLAWLGGQLLWVLQPFLVGMHGEWRRGHTGTGTSTANAPSLFTLAELLEDEKNIDRLVEHLVSASDGSDVPDRRKK